ncbi:MAG: DUF1097 family protein [Olsenella sp.]|jgi:hypothetical protein|nr:DUF1097 family protein [Olsenella sp.]
MSDRRKIKLVQALTGAIVLTLLMQVMPVLGYASYIWMLFLPLLLFFALGADFKKIPSMVVGYVCGCLWAMVNALVMQLFSAFGDNLFLSNVLPTIIVIFLILTTHENLLEGTIFGNVPSIFLGLSTSFFVFMLNVPLTPLHLIGFFCYGLVLASALVLSGMAVCGAIFGKERAMAALMPLPQDGEKGRKGAGQTPDAASDATGK